MTATRSFGAQTAVGSDASTQSAQPGSLTWPGTRSPRALRGVLTPMVSFSMTCALFEKFAKIGPFVFNRLRTLARSFALFCALQKPQPPYFHATAHSCAKTPGVGGTPLCEKRREMTENLKDSLWTTLKRLILTPHARRGYAVRIRMTCASAFAFVTQSTNGSSLSRQPKFALQSLRFWS